MTLQACKPCAKRKVRCDRIEPRCSNCKRRKQDDCVYPDLTPEDRIKQLEDTVRVLGGDPSASSKSATPRPGREQTSTTEDALSTCRENDNSIYLESRGWHAWINVARGLQGQTQQGLGGGHAHRPATHLPHALNSIFLPAQLPESETHAQLPFSTTNATKLWATFLQRVNPIVKLSFPWTLDRLQSALTDAHHYERLTPGERALAIVSCYFGVISLSREECVEGFGKSKADLIADYQLHCDKCFMQLNLLAIDDIESLKALCLYINASVDLVTSQSLWSLTGLVGRAAELLGLHRDGEQIGLGAVETEHRRRLWWQIQQIDLIMAVKNGSTPLTFTADWDVKLPLNIEDKSLVDPESDSLPPEQTGLTGASYMLFTFWVMNQQRKFRVLHKHTDVGPSLLGPLTNNIIDSLESGLQARFLQHCDPINPVHSVLLVSARALICLLRLRTMHESRLASGDMTNDFNARYFDLCMQQIGYAIATLGQAWLKPFHWLAEAGFSWHALIMILVDLPHLPHVEKTQAAWARLQDFYSCASFLKDFAGDKRRLRAAELAVAAWEACSRRAEFDNLQKPTFVAELQQALAQAQTLAATKDLETITLQHAETGARDLSDNFQDISNLFDFDFPDIDWLHWQ